MKTLSEQKAAQREQGEKKKMRRSTPELPERPFHVLSTLHGSASYSFGKPGARLTEALQ
ncbi:unnamed protein product [Effrenium voratum]|nr:unnamed protein product [Effrenium voratum]